MIISLYLSNAAKVKDYQKSSFQKKRDIASSFNRATEVATVCVIGLWHNADVMSKEELRVC